MPDDMPERQAAGMIHRRQWRRVAEQLHGLSTGGPTVDCGGCKAIDTGSCCHGRDSGPYAGNDDRQGTDSGRHTATGGTGGGRGRAPRRAKAGPQSGPGPRNRREAPDGASGAGADEGAGRAQQNITAHKAVASEVTCKADAITTAQKVPKLEIHKKWKTSKKVAEISQKKMRELYLDNIPYNYPQTSRFKTL